MDAERLTAHARANREEWNRWAGDYVADARRTWASEELYWGLWRMPEATLGTLPDVAGRDMIELGCGTAHWSSWLARRGARAVGIDISEGQLATAEALRAEYGIDFELIHGSAESVPLADSGFDLALSEYGASMWCDPYRWIPEAARLLRPGGTLVFLTQSVLLALCTPPTGAPAGRRLERPQRGMHAFSWPDGQYTDFRLPHGEMVALLRREGFVVEALHELYAPSAEDADMSVTPACAAAIVTPEWARHWPPEEIWVARKTRRSQAPSS